MGMPRHILSSIIIAICVQCSAVLEDSINSFCGGTGKFSPRAIMSETSFVYSKSFPIVRRLPQACSQWQQSEKSWPCKRSAFLTDARNSLTMQTQIVMMIQYSIWCGMPMAWCALGARIIDRVDWFYHIRGYICSWEHAALCLIFFLNH